MRVNSTAERGDARTSQSSGLGENQRAPAGGATNDVAVVILNYNNADDTIDCVKSLTAGNAKVRPIIVLDNGSAEGQISRIEEGLGDLVRTVALKANVGVAAGWNIAIRVALDKFDPTYILLLNNDTIIDPGLTDELVSFANTSERIGAAGPSIMRFDDRSKYQYPRHSEVSKPIRDKRLSGCALLVRTKTVVDVGFFDEEYFAYAEEYDFLERMVRSGWFSYYVPTTAKVYHKGARTSSSISGFEAFHRTRNWLLFAGKNLGGIRLFVSIASFFFKTLPPEILRDMFSSNRSVRITSRARGFLEGLRLFMRYRTDRRGSE